MMKAFSALGILIMCCTPIVFPLLVNDAYNEALLYLPVLVLGTIFNTVVSFYSAIYIAKKLTRQVMNTSIAAAIINLVVNLALIWLIGIWAAAISTAVAYAALAVYRHYDMKKYVTITYEKNLFVALILIFAVASGLYYANTLWTSVTGLILAAVAAYWLNRHEIGQMKSMIVGRLRK